MSNDIKRIPKEQDVNYTGQSVYRPTEKMSEPIGRHWKWIWLIVVVLVILAWAFLYWYFQNHHAPYSAPLN